ncbi:MAG TPA: permease prefix domain 2-containing transporter [Vicinamibacterales bacterium]|jgi:hypothetical protein|nr:permease prefix domain 2-containing transporter [Vicinamibacterales bacterium]
MTRHTTPPRIAEWLVSLVAAPEQSATIAGDLLEEFSGLVARSGTAPARRWYWRQSVRTIGHLLRGQLRQAPATIVAFAIGGFLLYVLVERALQMSAEAAVAHTRVYHLTSAVPFWHAVDTIGRYVLPVVVGWTIARAARGREMMAVLSVGITYTTWMLAIYTTMLLATSGLAQIHVPNFSMTALFCPPDSGPPHLGSVTNTLRMLRYTLISWWFPTIVLLSIGAAIRRATASGWIRTTQ